MKYTYRCVFVILFVLGFNSVKATATVIGIVGGTGAGKTTIANKLAEIINGETIIISQDSYYRDLSHLTAKQREEVNFDHPDSVEFNLLKKHLIKLKRNESIEIPIYDFTSHNRTKGVKKVARPQKVIIAEGILLLSVPEIRDLIDIKVFVDVEDDVRLLRRIKRDMEERGRSITNIAIQYSETVKPMHQEFVAPSKQFADIIVPHGAENDVAINLLALQLKKIISG